MGGGRLDRGLGTIVSARHVRQNTGSKDTTTHRRPHLPTSAAAVGCCPQKPGRAMGPVMGWSMVFSRQRPTSWTEAILFREVLHRSLGGARFFQHINNNVQPVRGAWYDGGGGGERHQQKYRVGSV